MDSDDRQLLLTTAWLFSIHGQASRARTLCEALVEADPRDGVAAIALAELLLDVGDAKGALKALTQTTCPKGLERAEALLETKALAFAGRKDEAAHRWKRYVATAKGSDRAWVRSGGK